MEDLGGVLLRFFYPFHYAAGMAPEEVLHFAKCVLPEGKWQTESAARSGSVQRSELCRGRDGEAVAQDDCRLQSAT
jgi:hypothetical protein